MKSLLKQKYPSLTVIGTNYPIPPAKELARNVVVILQMAVLAFVFLGDKVLGALGIAEAPPMLKGLTENKFGACMGIWFLGNLIASNLGNTGAFEIAYNGAMVFSKLGSGRMPTVEEIFHEIDRLQRLK